MPVYLCKPGWGQAKPHQHGIPVYAYPFPVQETPSTDMGSPATAPNQSRLTALNLTAAEAQPAQMPHHAANICIDANSTRGGPNQSLLHYMRPPKPSSTFMEPIRRVMHSEVVLVDEVSIHYNKYWLRLRWPGSRGGVAGYIVLGGAKKVPMERRGEYRERLDRAVIGLEGLMTGEGSEVLQGEGIDVDYAQEHEENEHELDDHNDDSDNESTDEEPAILRPSDDSPVQYAPKCESTGLYFPSTTTMELMAMYDDGLVANSDAAPLINVTENEDIGSTSAKGEPVFCRICREGLHDIDYDFGIEVQGGPTAGSGSNAAHESSAEGANPNAARREQIVTGLIRRTGNPTLHVNRNAQEASISKRAQQPSPSPQHAEQRNHPYAANPLLAPCECSGSMAFVHYLCVEQWRCRSHHPAARNGLNCETCNAPYTLAPPPSRPENEEEDVLDAMPPHVLAALRNPHMCWKIGAAVVRRKWLRPLAPVLMSPIVALYCRARRTLKKRGVSRRRWACSLCGRRARWKCVRCLRSYYCSRQCQNVSWHIVHKHVCYKPSRFWQSVIVYGLAFIYFVPGVLTFPLVYDLGLSFLWISFVVTGEIGGGIAKIMKRQIGFDIRGRGLEVLVVLMTVWLASICWGLVWAFFGESRECKGVFYNPLWSASFDDETKADIGFVPSIVQMLVLNSTKTVLISMDNLLLKTGPLVTKWICHSDEVMDRDFMDHGTCLQLTQKANPQFLLAENGEKCVSDMNTVASFWALAVFMHCLGYLSKWVAAVALAVAPARRRLRPHQD